MVKLKKSGNATFLLNYHLIVVVKYRKKVFISDEIINALKQFVIKVGEDFDVNIIEQECGDDHIHILFSAKPTLDMTKFINIIKGHSSRELRKTFKLDLKNKLWGDSFWSPSYFLATAGNVSLDTLSNYIQNQRTLDSE